MASVRSSVALGTTCALLAAMLLAGPQLGAAPGLAALVVVGAALLSVGLGYRRRREPDEGQSVWGHIPSWQYTGRHVESGGLTRDEQGARPGGRPGTGVRVRPD